MFRLATHSSFVSFLVLATGCGGKNGSVPEPPTVKAPDMDPLYDRDTASES